MNPDDFDAHTYLANIFQDNKDCEAAIPHWLGRLKTKNSYSVYVDLGNAYFRIPYPESMYNHHSSD